MPDALEQIQQRQAIARDQEIAGAQADLDWNATFGRMAPDNVLRETRNMTALIANAVERKMELAAQTSAEAQRIYINDKKFRAWQQSQPLRDDLLKAQLRDEEATTSAREATELLTISRKERATRGIEHTALAELEMDQIESANIPEADKRARLNTVRGRFPLMDKNTAARHGKLHSVFNPVPGSTPDEKIANAVEQRRQIKALDLTPEQIRANKVQDKRELMALDAPKEPKLPSTGTETITSKNKDGTVSRITRPLPRSISGGVAQPSQVDMPAATPAPATAARKIFKDANGKRAYQNPDGTFEEIL